MKEKINYAFIHLTEKFLTLTLILVVIKLFNLGYIANKLDSCNKNQICKIIDHAFEGFLKLTIITAPIKGSILGAIANKAISHEDKAT